MELRMKCCHVFSTIYAPYDGRSDHVFVTVIKQFHVLRVAMRTRRRVGYQIGGSSPPRKCAQGFITVNTSVAISRYCAWSPFQTDIP